MQSKPRVLANATVDLVDAGPVPLWDVKVWGEPPHEHTRTYTLQAKTDDNAAQEGIRQFVEEMENLYS